MSINADELIEYIYSLGADLAGMADLSPLPEAGRGGLNCGVAFGIALNPEVARIIDGKTGSSVGVYFTEYNEINARLDDICVKVADYIAKRGYKAVAQTVDYIKKQRKDRSDNRPAVPHKTVAALAGFGWIGKSSLLITKKYGSAIRISSVLTDMPFNVKNADYVCMCGGCALCVNACPAGAIHNVLWNANTDRDEMIDAAVCNKEMVRLGKLIGVDHAPCGLCVTACPHSKHHIRGL